MTIQELEQFITEYGKDIYSFCIYLTGDRHLADDLYQDTFLEALSKLENIQGSYNPRSYLLSISVNLWNNRKRKYRNRTRLKAEFLKDEEKYLPDICEDIVYEERRKKVIEAVLGLKKNYRIPVLLYYMEDMDIREISGVLRIPEGTVKSRLYKARNLLKNRLKEYIDE